METLILIAALACQPGYSLLDWSGKLPRELQFLDLVVFVESFLHKYISTNSATPIACNSVAATN
jgi:hypothetical protein